MLKGKRDRLRARRRKAQKVQRKASRKSRARWAEYHRLEQAALLVEARKVPPPLTIRLGRGIGMLIG